MSFRIPGIGPAFGWGVGRPATRRAVRFAAVVLLLIAPAAAADEITVATSGAFTAALQKLVPAFEHSTRHHVPLVFGASMGDTQDSIPNRDRKSTRLNSSH